MKLQINIYSYLKEISQIILNILKKIKTEKEFKSFLSEFKFKEKNSSGRTFISKKLGIVFKFAYLSFCHRKPSSEYIIPSYIRKIPKYIDHCLNDEIRESYLRPKYRFICQPIANTKNSGKAYHHISKRQCEFSWLHWDSLFGGDLKEDNVGYYNNKPVIFDW